MTRITGLFLILCLCAGAAEADTAYLHPATVAEMRDAALTVSRLPPGPGGYGRDCVWRTERLIQRLELEGADMADIRRQRVGWFGRNGRICNHAVARVTTPEGVFIADGQAGAVYPLRGQRAGPYKMGGC